MKNHVFDDQLSRLSKAEAARLEEHPTAEELLNHVEGRLDKTRVESILEHLSLCRDCTATVLDLGGFPNVSLREPGFERGEKDIEADWLSIEARLAAESSATKPDAHGVPPTEIGGGRKPRPVWMGLAAILALGLTFGILVGRYLVPVPSGAPVVPIGNIHFQELVPAEDPTIRSSTVARISLPVSARSLVLILATRNLDDHSAYVATLESAERRWRVHDLRRSSDGSFSIELPREMLRSGAYRLDLKADSLDIASYRFKLQLDH